LDGAARVVVLIGQGPAMELVCLNASGEVTARVPGVIWHEGFSHGDLDGDGADEVVFRDSQGEVQVYRGDLQSRLWNRSAHSILALKPGSGGAMPMVLVQWGVERMALAGATGDAVWRAPGAGPGAELGGGPAGTPPRWVGPADDAVALGRAWLCRPAMATLPSGYLRLGQSR
jgi:hypothetical protein